MFAARSFSDVIQDTPDHPIHIIVSGEGTVMIENETAARSGDVTMPFWSEFVEQGVILTGSGTVMIGGLPAARTGDACSTGGLIMNGASTVIIGD